jgi:glutamate decarboxylase
VEERIQQLFTPEGRADFSEARQHEYAAQLAQAFLTERHVSSSIGLGRLEGEFLETEVPSYPSTPLAYLRYLEQNVVPHAVHTSSTRFIGHMTSCLPNFVRPLSMLMTSMNQNMVKVETSKILTPYERQAIAMLHRRAFEFPPEFYHKHVQCFDSTLGVATSGGTVANITGLWAARNALLGPIKHCRGVEIDGVMAALKAHGYEGAAVIGSSLMHYSLDKAMRLLGLGAANLIRIPVDRDCRVSPELVERAIARCRARRVAVVAVIGLAGSTEAGSIDPLADLARVARAARVHFHVDAAWGGALLLSDRHRPMLAGIQLADSISVDGHKQMYLPMGMGITLFRDPTFAKAIEVTARYIVRPHSPDLGKRALEGSRAATALFLQAALHLIGREGYEYLLDRSMERTRYLVEALRARPEFELLVQPTMNIVLYRWVPQPWRDRARSGALSPEEQRCLNEFTVRLQREQRRRGYTFVSRTSIEVKRGRRTTLDVALRAVLLNPLSTNSDVDAVLDDQSAIAGELLAEQPPVDLKLSPRQEGLWTAARSF